ncbi:MAG: hypothetical protein U9R48_10030 [Chloroflexota bacterium]|nr:hypothetical protein [Chloroflexota bacterium]
MHRYKPILLVVTTIILLLVTPWPVTAEKTELKIYFSPECGHCEMVREQVLTPLKEAYGDKLTLIFVDVSTPEGLQQLESVERRLGRLNNPLPVIVVDERIIASEDLFQIQDELEAILRERLGEQTESPEATPTITDAVPTETPPPEATASGSSVPTIHVAYVKKEGCDDCSRARLVLQALNGEFKGVRVTAFDNVHDAERVEAMGEHLDLPPNRRLIAPSIYVGDDVLVGDEITTENVRQLLAKYEDSGASAFWKDLDIASGKRHILERFESMGPLTVATAALVDGVNPCAFATILFFVSYLAISRRRRKELLAIGLAFTAGVFVTYFAIGLGAMSLLRIANTIRVVGLVLYGLMALSCFVLAGLSVHDYFLARQGKLHDMRLNLLDPLRERIKGRIRATSSAFVGTAFVSGLIVSLLELACTGQVYLPTISFAVGVPQMRAYAIAYLALYNLVFVLPLLAVLLLAVYGVSAKQFQDWFVENAARSKLIMSVLFVLLGCLLLVQFLNF